MGNTPTAPVYDVKGKVFVVTGANSGIGKETAKQIAKSGGHVILACRSLERGQNAFDEINNLIPTASLELIQLDLDDFSSVKQFSSELHEKHKHIDVLINNAALVPVNYEKGQYNLERALTVNYLGLVFTTELLLDLLEAAPKTNGRPRVVNVSSNAHTFSGPLSYDQLKLDESKVGTEMGIVDSMANYGRTKTCGLLYQYSLNQRLREKKSPILVYSVDPGWVSTELSRGGKEKFYFGAIKALESVVAQEPEQGAIPSVFCACAPQLDNEETSGRYYLGIDKEGPIKDYANDEQTAIMLWRWTERQLWDWLGRTGELPPEIIPEKETGAVKLNIDLALKEESDVTAEK